MWFRRLHLPVQVIFIYGVDNAVMRMVVEVVVVVVIIIVVLNEVNADDNIQMHTERRTWRSRLNGLPRLLPSLF